MQTTDATATDALSGTNELADLTHRHAEHLRSRIIMAEAELGALNKALAATAGAVEALAAWKLPPEQ